MRSLGESPIRDMFDALVPEYDRFNSLSSFGLDFHWRKKVSRLFSPESHVLDVGTGTGDLAKAIGLTGSRVVGVDFSSRMVEAAQRKLKDYGNISFTVGRAEELPFEPRSFDGLTSAFVIRNLHHAGILNECLKEFYRVLKPGGQMVHLELTRPQSGLMAWGHKKYMELVLPLIGKSVFGQRWPENYLSQTIERFPSPPALCEQFRWAGFERVVHYPLSGGIAGLFMGARC